MNKINTWLSMLWRMNKDESNQDINELRRFLFRLRTTIEEDYKLIKEEENEMDR